MSIANLKRPNSFAQELDDATIHNWYRFVLSYPDHLVSGLIERFGARPGNIVLDPFVGTGTTLVECKRRGIDSIGIDANPVTAFASRVKTTWDIDLQGFDHRFVNLRELVRQPLLATGKQYAVQLSFDDLFPAGQVLRDGELFEGNHENLLDLLPKNWISETPLQKCLVVTDVLGSWPEDSLTDLFRLALADVLVSVSNLGFGPEVYVSKTRQDADVYGLLLAKLRQMRHDLAAVQKMAGWGTAVVHTADARKLTNFIQKPVDFVICSPPYPNEKDYSRITRLELILLGFMQSKSDLRAIKEEMLRSHTRNIYTTDNDSQYVADVPAVQKLAQEIEQRRLERGATSGFERLYHRVVTEYFGGMYRVMEQLQQVMPVGGKIAFVVGDQFSYFRTPIYTAQILNQIACQKLNYREVETVLWRTRKSTVTKMDVEEHILILERC
jgi:hypothetical protein